MTRLVALAAAVSLATTPASAQSLADRIGAARDETVVLRFQPRPGICASEDGGIRWVRSAWTSSDWYSGSPCVAGPVRVTLGRDGKEVVSVRARIAVRPVDAAGTTDLGEVSAADAARYLTTLAHHLAGRNADEALTAAAIADGYDVWPDFRRLVLDADVPMHSREQALFWIGQSDTPTANVVSLYTELAPLALREHYTFVLSQRHDDDEAVDKLIDVARHDRDGGVRKQAMFWLGQSRSPKATKFFRDVLTP
jgi:hypothetical protein